MLKQILIAVLTLAIFVGCYLLYSMLLSEPQMEQATTVPTKIPESMLATTKQPTLDATRPEEMLLHGRGEESWFYRWSKEGKLLYQFRVDRWRSAGQDNYTMENPELRVFLNRGQIVHVSATKGLIKARKVGGGKANLDPVSGKLSGKVHIFIDRGTAPDREAPQLREQDIIHLWLDSIDFDLENCTVVSDSVIKVESLETEMIGRGVDIRWDDITRELKNLRITEGEKLIYHTNSDVFGIDLPGGKKKDDKTQTSNQGMLAGFEGGTTTQPAAKSRAKKEPEIPGILADGSGATSKPTTTSAPTTQPKSHSYMLTFGRKVRVLEFNGPRQIGSLTCEKLSLLFDASGLKNGDDTTSQPTSKPTTREAFKPGGRRLEIFWSGPLEVLPTQLPYSPVRRFHVVASGKPVVVEQIGKIRARCQKLEYHVESRQGWMHGTVNESVTIREGRGRSIVATRLFYDGKNGIARGEGPGYMEQVEGVVSSVLADDGKDPLDGKLVAFGKKMTVTWQEGFELQFGLYDVATETGTARQQYLKRAEFRGPAKMLQMDHADQAQPSEAISGQRVVMTFKPPQPTATSPAASDTSEGAEEPASRMEKSGTEMGDLSGTIDKVLANGDVSLMSGEQKIACENLVVVFGEGQRGRVPNQAFARGHVRINEARRSIEAEEILATMEERPAPVTSQPTTTQKKDLLVALIQPKEKTSGLSRIVLREVEASGDVRIDDPDRQMKVESDRLRCKLDGEGTITWCYLEGSKENWASAESRGNLISGEQVTMDIKTEYAEVPGPGQMQFVSDRDIDGSTYGRSQPVLISWAESMVMEGSERNQGIFTGDVKVVSDNTVMKCQQVLIDFETAPETVAPQQTKTTLVDRFPIFERIIGEKRIKSKNVKLPIAKKRPSYIRALPAENSRIQIENRVDENNTVLTRTTLNGSQLTIDLSARRMNVPADGYLVIEDYRLPKATQGGDIRSSSALRDPFGMDMSARGPSQTAFTWKNGLTYMLDTRTAIFDGDVWMGHESGQAVLAEMRRQQAAAANKSATSQPTSAQAAKDEKAAEDENASDGAKSKATLSCENLVAEFIRGPFGPGGAKAGARAGAAELSRVIATGSVNLADGKRSAMGRQLRYDNQQKLVLIYGTPETPAYIEMEENEGKFTTYSGPMVSYNRSTGRVEAQDATITLVR